MREKGQSKAVKTLETPVFSRGIEILTEKFEFIKNEHSFFKEAFKSNDYNSLVNYDFNCIYDFYRTIFENK